MTPVEWNLIWVLVGLALAGGTALVRWLGTKKGWWGNVARTIEKDVKVVEPYIDPAINTLTDLFHNGVATQQLHNLEHVLNTTLSTAQTKGVEALIGKWVNAAKTDIASLTSTQLGAVTSYVIRNVPPEWKSVVTPSMVVGVVKTVVGDVSLLRKDPLFQEVQNVSQYSHTLDTSPTPPVTP